MFPCFGGNNGAVDINVTGGITPYTYTWSNGSTTQDLNNLVAGTYCATVSDASGCTATTCVTITQPTQIVATATTTSATCGQSNGTATVNATGGTPGYTYQWANGATTQTISGLAAGSYCVTVTDTKGCTATACATVGASGNLSATTSTTPAQCFGTCNGTITVDVAGGVPSYTYTWTNSNGANGNGGPIGAEPFTITGLCASTYTVTVTDGSGCTTIVTATVGQPTQVVATATTTAATCGLANGSVDLTVSGGSTPYTYLWQNGATTQDLVNVAAGTYCVTVTDSHGCTATTCATVGTANGPNLTTTTTNVSCFGGNNGSINLTVSGGTTPYTYIWQNGATAQDLNNLVAGTYCVTVTDASGCTATTCATITQPATAVTVTGVITNATCNQATGAIDITATGGTAPYTYGWNTGATTQDLNNLNAGNYCVTVTDAQGCTATSCFTVLQGNCCAATAIGNPTTSCGAANGSMTVSVTNGTPAYSWVLSNGAAGLSQNAMFTITSLQAGSYCVTITDAAGCTSTACAVVNSTGSFALTPLHICAPTCGQTDGNIILDVVGGTAPFTFTWAGDAGSGTGNSLTEPITINDLVSGDFCVTITDATGCQATFCTTVPGATGLIVGSVPACATFCGGHDGKITVGVFNGTGPYSYNWTDADGNVGTGTGTGNPFVVPNLPAGSYDLTVTSVEGCTGTTSAVITKVTLITASATTTGVVCGGDQGTITVNIENGSGPYTWTGVGNGGTATTEPFTITGLTSGTYTISVVDAAGCDAVVTATVGGNIGGTAFNDFNANCDFGDEEMGLDSVLVYLYECNSPLPVDSIWTDVNGTFLFPNLNNYPYRLEFVVIKDSCCLKPSLACAGVGTTVQFIDAANCDIRVGFLNPADYCQNDPEIAFSCFAQGKTDDVTSQVIGLIPYNAVDRTEIYGDVSANNELIGSVYGLAYDRSNKYLYASAFLKRHVGLGELGLGGIYRVDYHNGANNPTVTEIYTVPNVGIVDRPADLSAPNIPSMDSDAFGKVGKVGLGDLDISGDNTFGPST